MQPIPKVTHEDVERIVRRDFPADQRVSVMSILEEYGKDKWHPEKVRVHLAILKLAANDLNKLRHFVETAKSDCRDVLAWAEYPENLEKTFADELPVEERQQLVNRDWKQYETWLRAK